MRQTAPKVLGSACTLLATVADGKRIGAARSCCTWLVQREGQFRVHNAPVAVVKLLP